MLTEVIQDFVEDVGDSWSSLHQGVTWVLHMFSQTLSNQEDREHVSQELGDQGANEMPENRDILGFPPHGGNHIKRAGQCLEHSLTERIDGKALGDEGDRIERVIL